MKRHLFLRFWFMEKIMQNLNIILDKDIDKREKIALRKQIIQELNEELGIKD